MSIYSRADWGAVGDAGGNVIVGPVAEVYVHHFNSGIAPETAVESAKARMRSCQAYHRSLGWADIGYSWCVSDAGDVFEGRGWWLTGAHTAGFNSKGYGICWLGDSTRSAPSPAALRGIAEIIRVGVDGGAITPAPLIVGHRDRNSDTACPGDPLELQLPTIRSLVESDPTVTPDQYADLAARLDRLAAAVHRLERGINPRGYLPVHDAETRYGVVGVLPDTPGVSEEWAWRYTAETERLAARKAR